MGGNNLSGNRNPENYSILGRTAFIGMMRKHQGKKNQYISQVEGSLPPYI